MLESRGESHTLASVWLTPEISMPPLPKLRAQAVN